MTTKHFLTGATLLSGLLLLNAPLFAAVESDVVGYASPELNLDGFTMVGVPFLALDSTKEDASVAINDFLSGDFVAGDAVQYWDGSKYQVLTFRAASNLNGEQMGPAWCEGRSTYSTKRFTPGEAFWVKTSAPSMMMAGRVGDRAIVETKANTLTMVANPRPQAIAINDIVCSAPKVGDSIQVYDGAKYTVLTYRATSSLDGVQKGAAWCEGRSTYSTYVVPVGTAFWIKTANNCVLTF